MRFQILVVIFFLGGCATVPALLRGDFAEVTPQQAQDKNLAGQRVRWGGEISKTMPGKDTTCFELIGRALDVITSRPLPGSGAQGRFLACISGFYDPAIYAPGRELTVVGTLIVSAKDTIGGYDHRYSRMTAEALYLWPPRTLYYYPNSDPFCGYWNGHWHGRCDYWPDYL